MRKTTLRRLASSRVLTVLLLAALGTEVTGGEYVTVVTLGSFKEIRVDASYGAIAPGDLLVSAPIPGHAMRSDGPAPGTVIDKALGVLPAGTGTVPVIVTLN